MAQADNPGLLIVDTTSGYPDDTRQFGQRLATRGMRLIDAAITGERGGANAIPERNLTFIVGGEAADVAEARRALDHFGSHLFHLGPLGAGQIAKMVNNMVCAVVGVGPDRGPAGGRETGRGSPEGRAGPGSWHRRQFLDP